MQQLRQALVGVLIYHRIQPVAEGRRALTVQVFHFGVAAPPGGEELAQFFSVVRDLQFTNKVRGQESNVLPTSKVRGRDVGNRNT
jgi:hypothetical protein